MDSAQREPVVTLEEKGLPTRSKLAWWVGGAGAVVAVIGAGVFSVLGDSPQASAAQGAALPEVTASRPLVRNLDTRLGFLGQFSAVNKVDLRAQVGGTLTGIHFTDGQWIKKGALLFSIDPVPYEIKLAQARAQQQRATARLAYAKSEFRRADELASNQAGSVQNMELRKSDWQEAEAALADANAQIRDAQFDLDHCQIFAPFAGRVGNHNVSIGNLIAGSRAAASPTTLLATLISQDPIYLDFDMSEADYRAYQGFTAKRPAGTTARVEIAAGGANDFSTDGTLDFIDNTLNRASGTIHARATVSNAQDVLTPGAFARVRVIASAAAPTLLVPDAAVLPDQSRFNVLTVGQDGVVAARQVEVGEMRSGLRTITAGLSATDQVIIGGLPFAAPGAKVNVKQGQIKSDNDLVKE
jgi:RND family efflux transporter MFP subunit